MDPFDFDENRRRYEQLRRESDIITTSFIMDATVLATIGDEDNSPPRRQPNRERQRQSRGQHLLEDYFVERPIFLPQDFRRRYRMSSNLFNRIKTALCNYDTFWHQRRDATQRRM
ncbi:unnamed protein product [Rhodiola kirilowii]